MQRERKERLSKREWHALGGLKNSALYRKQSKGGTWRYYRSLGYGHAT